MTDQENHRQDRRLNMVVIGTACTTLIILLLGVVSVVTSIGSSNNTVAIREGDEIASCRAIYAIAETAAQGQLLIASSNQGVATGNLVRLVSAGLEANIRGDDSALGVLQAQLPIASSAVATAEDSVNTAQKLVDQASALRVEKGVLAKEDPKAFLRECRA